MELKDFVKESIVHISKGIDEANTEFLESETHAMVNPLSCQNVFRECKGVRQNAEEKQGVEIQNH